MNQQSDEAYAQRVNSYSARGAQLDYEAVMVAAAIINTPISVLFADELDPDTAFPSWHVQSDSLPGQPWKTPNDANTDHILLIYYNNHYDAAPLINAQLHSKRCNITLRQYELQVQRCIAEPPRSQLTTAGPAVFSRFTRTNQKDVICVTYQVCEWMTGPLTFLLC